MEMTARIKVSTTWLLTRPSDVFNEGLFLTYRFGHVDAVVSVP
jgi:hypothetical protein